MNIPNGSNLSIRHIKQHIAVMNLVIRRTNLDILLSSYYEIPVFIVVSQNWSKLFTAGGQEVSFTV